MFDNDLASEEVPINNSAKKNKNMPWILTHAYEFDINRIGEKGNKIKCKACGIYITWNLNDPTTNLGRHIKDTNPIKHAEMKLSICNKQSPSTKDNYAKKRLVDMFDTTSKSASNICSTQPVLSTENLYALN